ncbi:thiamine-phosphate kinase [Pseudonocardia sp. HH130630-07]|uniref:thiamine-phosphate kinase n=1 Tax=Pseudonocardia sp. HH130630-07 TaxID=1690815 RepID=UPI000814B7D0|nr:thiamine-phosphate kinase [Pseudonocardia sp. HH130630-07]ANY10212.1 thiamine monophosphate kinase [Pseudonocardia sp. HH130630-07]
MIGRITTDRAQPDTTVLGPGDDSAIVAAADGRVVACTDVLVEGVHFRLDWSTPEQIGRKAAAANLADVAAMGAVPTSLLVGLACPSATPAAALEQIADGLWAEASAVGAGLVGGDLTSGPVLVVSVTALGSLQGREPVLRSGARPGDRVAVCGRLGWSAAGLAVLGRGFRSPAALVNAHRLPEPPYAEGPAAALAGATAMIDVSDGLLADLGHVARASTVTVRLRSRAFTVAPRLAEIGSALGLDPLRWILTGGEDHALVATFPAETGPPGGWTEVGVVEAPDDGGPAVTVDGRPYDGDAGWSHFAG